MRRILKGIGYVSIWVLVWGTFGSIIDAGLLQVGAYLEGGAEQATTFIVAAVISVAGAFSFYKEVLGNNDSKD